MTFSDTVDPLVVFLLSRTILPFSLSMWFHGQAMQGWGISAALIFFWHVISYGADYGLPKTLIDTDSDAQYVYWILLSVLILVCALAGTIVSWLLGLHGILPFYTFSRKNWWLRGMGEMLDTGLMTVPAEDQAELQAALDRLHALELQRWGYNSIVVPLWHNVVTLLGFFVCCMLPFLLYDVIYNYHKLAAFLVGLFLQLVGFVLLALYWVYRTDLYVWGPSAYNLAERELEHKKDQSLKIGSVAIPQTALGTSDEGLYNYKDSVRELIFKRTRNAIIKNVVALAVLQILGFLLLTVATSFVTNPSFNVMWPIALVYVLFVVAILFFVYLIFLFVDTGRQDEQKIASANGNGCGNGKKTCPLPTQQRYASMLGSV
jgi:hypothetical protein